MHEVGMLFTNRKKLILFLAPLLVLGCLMLFDAKLDVYSMKKTGRLVYQDKEFQSGYDTYKKFYVNGERNFRIDKLIGKTDNSKFLGFKESVWSIEGVPEDEVVFVKGLMVEGIYERD
jgi:hypothetical protein